MIYYFESESEKIKHSKLQFEFVGALCLLDISTMCHKLLLFATARFFHRTREKGAAAATTAFSHAVRQLTSQRAGPHCARSHTITHTKDFKSKIICMTWFIWSAFFSAVVVNNISHEIVVCWFFDRAQRWMDYICFDDVLIVVKIESHTCRMRNMITQKIASFLGCFWGFICLFVWVCFFEREKKYHMIYWQQVDNIQM